MNNADFWASVRTIIAEGFTPEGLQKLDSYATEFISGDWYINDFHRRNSMTAQREVMQMSLHPCSREQKLAQIARIQQHSALSIATFESILQSCETEEQENLLPMSS